MIAFWMNYDQIYAAAMSLEYKEFVDLDIRNWLIKWEKIIQKISTYIGDIQFEDLSIPLTIVATDMNSGEEIWFTTGSVLKAIRYSIWIPGVFVVAQDDNGKSYADGWLVNNLPVNYIHSEHVVAVSCQGVGRFEGKTSKMVLWIEIDTSWMTIHTRVMMRSLNIMMSRIEDFIIAEHPNVILIRPNLEKISSFDLKALDEAITIGYKEAKLVLGSH